MCLEQPNRNVRSKSVIAAGKRTGMFPKGTGRFRHAGKIAFDLGQDLLAASLLQKVVQPQVVAYE